MISNGHYSTSNPRYVFFWYCSGDVIKHFDCVNQGAPTKNEILRLYLTSDDLVRSTDSTLRPLAFLLAPCAKPVQSPSTGFRLREVRFYINNDDNRNGEPRCFPPGSCLTTWTDELLGPEDVSKSGHLARGGALGNGRPVKACSPGVDICSKPALYLSVSSPDDSLSCFAQQRT